MNLSDSSIDNQEINGENELNGETLNTSNDPTAVSSDCYENSVEMKVLEDKTKKKESLLNTKSYLMNSLLHFHDRDKILAQLSKQKMLDQASRNFHHGRLYNYVLPQPSKNYNKKLEVKAKY